MERRGWNGRREAEGGNKRMMGKERGERQGRREEWKKGKWKRKEGGIGEEEGKVRRVRGEAMMAWRERGREGKGRLGKRGEGWDGRKG